MSGVDEFFDKVPLWLAEDRAVIAKVCGPVYVKRKGTSPAHQPSRHGDLAPPGDWGGPFHAIVIIARSDAGLAVLDPYYPAAGQPILITDDVMSAIFACDVVVA